MILPTCSKGHLYSRVVNVENPPKLTQATEKVTQEAVTGAVTWAATGETPQGTIKEPPEVLGAQREGIEEITGDTTEVQNGSTAGRPY